MPDAIVQRALSRSSKARNSVHARRLFSAVRAPLSFRCDCGHSADGDAGAFVRCLFRKDPPGAANRGQADGLRRGECGHSAPSRPRFNFRYYYYALLFVVFDVETVFLYPWAVRYGVLTKQFGLFALGAVLVFLAVVTVAYVYAWRKKALEWV